jgi:hypothetical protein
VARGLFLYLAFKVPLTVLPRLQSIAWRFLSPDVERVQRTPGWVPVGKLNLKARSPCDSGSIARSVRPLTTGVCIKLNTRN